MMTAGPEQLEVMSFPDWVALLKYAEQSSYTPVVLRTLAIDPDSVVPEDLADELDHVLDTQPPAAVVAVIGGILRRLQAAGVILAARDG